MFGENNRGGGLDRPSGGLDEGQTVGIRVPIGLNAGTGNEPLFDAPAATKDQLCFFSGRLGIDTVHVENGILNGKGVQLDLVGFETNP